MPRIADLLVQVTAEGGTGREIPIKNFQEACDWPEQPEGRGDDPKYWREALLWPFPCESNMAYINHENCSGHIIIIVIVYNSIWQLVINNVILIHQKILRFCLWYQHQSWYCIAYAWRFGVPLQCYVSEARHSCSIVVAPLPYCCSADLGFALPKNCLQGTGIKWYHVHPCAMFFDD